MFLFESCNDSQSCSFPATTRTKQGNKLSFGNIENIDKKKNRKKQKLKKKIKNKKINPADTPLLIRGRVIKKKTRNLPAPRFIPASSSDISKKIKVDVTARII